MWYGLGEYKVTPLGGRSVRWDASLCLAVCVYVYVCLLLFLCTGLIALAQRARFALVAREGNSGLCRVVCLGDTATWAQRHRPSQRKPTTVRVSQAHDARRCKGVIGRSRVGATASRLIVGIRRSDEHQLPHCRCVCATRMYGQLRYG